ncbi:stabilizer of axonemal microtubules 2-like [Chanos chanos]|uniref:Stabilizer of axonemal microtubules 2-like n=1 Tax=Chanos chanos TaxID=29144 RepID=A0A6J2VTL6_CHACN|nr:stabilizer of axonemal microtubules 2-like [Chanos chanos]
MKHPEGKKTIHQCLCQICTCGRHQCPYHRNMKETAVPYTDCMATVHPQNYPANFSDAYLTAERPQSERLLPKSKSVLDYVPPEVKRRSRRRREHVLHDDSMRLTSTYAQDYQKHTVQKNIRKAKTAEYCPPSVKMHAKSVYQEDFKVWRTEKRQPYRENDNLTVNEGKFATSTTFRDDYCPKGPVTARENFKPLPEVLESFPFDGVTNYQLHYVPHPVQARQLKEKQTYESYESPSDPFQGTSTYKEDFKGFVTEVPKRIRRKIAWENNPAPFEGTTEYRYRYKAWQTAPKEAREVEEWTPPEGEMAFLSTAHSDYVKHECQPPQPIRPPIQCWEKDKEPFQAKSVMKEDYKACEVTRPSAAVHVEELDRPTGAFERVTTYTSEYTPKTAERPVSYKPTQEDTAYSTSYEQKELEPCPASYAEPTGLERDCTESKGYRLYRTFSAGHTSPAKQAPVKSQKPTHCHSQNQRNCAANTRNTRAH